MEDNTDSLLLDVTDTGARARITAIWASDSQTTRYWCFGKYLKLFVSLLIKHVMLARESFWTRLLLFRDT
jgi:hypothetical protein